MKNTPNYIKTLLMPSTKPPTGRKAWSIDLEMVWLPFFTATNVMGDTAIPHDALGAPLRLAYQKDGSVKFSSNGRPVIRVVKNISDTVKLVRENFVANLRDYASQIAESHKDEYGEHISLQRDAGMPIRDHDRVELDKAIQLQIEETMAEAERKRQTEAVAETTPPEIKPEPELVTV